MKEKGILIGVSNPQPEIRKNAEGAKDWEYNTEAAWLYKLAVIFKDELVDPIEHTDRSRVPDPVISLENLRNNNTLAAYTLARNPQGLLHEITLNTAHYDTVEGKKVWRYGKWAQAESLLHEMLHLKQQKYGKEPYKRGKSTHNKEFCEMAKQLGLNVMPNVGCHTAVADEGSPFARVMHELGIQRPEEKKSEGKMDWFEADKKRKGESTLKKWTCPECKLNVRIGIKGDPMLIHAPCSVEKGAPVFFIRADQEVMGQTIYEAPKKEGGVIEAGNPKRRELRGSDSPGPTDIDDIIKRQMEEGYRSNDASEDLSTYLEPYQNDYGDI